MATFGRGYFGSFGLRKKTNKQSVNFTVNFKVLKKGAVKRVPSLKGPVSRI